MTETIGQSLIMIPDHLSTAAGAFAADSIVIADLAKLPRALCTANCLDVNEPSHRQKLMLLVPAIDRFTVLTPAMSYYRRVCELRDDCYFADLTLRLIANGASGRIITGMRRAHVPPMAAEWLRTLARYGLHIQYEETPENALPARDLITAADIASCAKQGRREILAAKDAIITPYAVDEAKERGIAILRGI